MGFPELFMLFILALLLFGPEKLPELVKTVGRAFREFRRMSTELQNTMHETVQTIHEGTGSGPSLKEIYERVDPKRALEEVKVRPFADPAPGSLIAPPAVDADVENVVPARPMGGLPEGAPAPVDSVDGAVASLTSGASELAASEGGIDKPSEHGAGDAPSGEKTEKVEQSG